MGAKFVVDSYNSNDPTKSTNGFYDPAKRTMNADTASDANGKDVNIGGAYLFGDLACNGGTPKATQNVSGTIRNDFYEQLTDVQNPNWTSWNPTPTSIVNMNVTLKSGPKAAPERYVLSAISQNTYTITFQAPPPGETGYTEIWVTKDATFSNGANVIIPSNVYVSIYINGKFSMTGGAFVNSSKNPMNLSLYGIVGKAGTYPQWVYNSEANFIGTIYGTQIKYKVTGTAGFYGAIAVYSLDFGGGTGAGFHFDEALLKPGASPPHTASSQPTQTQKPNRKKGRAR
jgi:hypothetical protein